MHVLIMNTQLYYCLITNVYLKVDFYIYVYHVIPTMHLLEGGGEGGA